MNTNTKVKVHGIRIEETGGPEVLQYSEFEIRQPGPDEVLVNVHAAGVNFIDVYMRQGRYPTSLPFTPGLEGSGIVERIGSNVTSVKIGDHVAYSSTLGSYADAAVIPADRVIPVPSGFSYEQAAAFPLQGMTAHYLLFEFHTIAPGETVLIHAAAGGMGQLLVQWAKHLGARVIGTVSTESKAELARKAGADEVILYSEVDFVAETKRLTMGKGADFIIDGVGKDTFPGSLEAVKTRGHVVIYGSASGPAEPIAPNALQGRAITISGGSLNNFIVSRDELIERANAVIAGIQEGWLKLTIDHVYPLADATLAHEMLQSRQTTGKVVLKCRD